MSHTYGDSLHADMVASVRVADAVLDAINAGTPFDSLITDADLAEPDAAPMNADSVVSIRDNWDYQE